MSFLSTFLTPVALALAALYIALQAYIRATQDRREPPVVEIAIPFITPILGLRKHTYYNYLRTAYPHHPIFTLRLPFQKIYVVTSANLIAALQRQYKSISFQFVEDGMSNAILSLSAEGRKKVEDETREWTRVRANTPSPGHVQFGAMAPGEGLDYMNGGMVRGLGGCVEGCVGELEGRGEGKGEGKGMKKVGLFEWVKELVVVPTTDGVFGEGNPFREEGVRRAYWTFLSGVPLMAKRLRFLVPSSTAAHATLSHAFETYFSSSSHLSTSGFAPSIQHYYASRSFSPPDTAQIVAATSIAILGNTIPTAFWFLLRLFSSPTVLSACRAEVLAQVAHSTDDAGLPVHTLDVTALKTSCPLLNSTFREVLRHDAIGANVRGVAEDVLLDGKYKLEKGALVFIPLGAQHGDTARWGADAEEFVYDRFADKARAKVHSNSFRSFGGGTTLCPGRHFVTTELLALAAMVLCRFEVRPVGGGEWVVPGTEGAEMVTTVPEPDWDVEVEVRRREGDRDGGRWVWGLSGSEVRVGGGDVDEEGREV